MANLAKPTEKSLNPQWKAKLEETLNLSKDIIQGKAGLARMEMGLQIKDTFSKPTIRSVFKQHGKIGFSVATVLVQRFADSFGFSTKLTENQVETITVDTLENFSYESLEDIILFFKMARSGKFGTTGRGIDSNLIFGDWFPKYLEQKAELREREYERKKSEMKATPVSMEDVKKTYSENQQKQNWEKAKLFVEKITKNMDRQMLEDTIIDWEKDPKKKYYVKLLKAKRRTI